MTGQASACAVVRRPYRRKMTSKVTTMNARPVYSGLEVSSQTTRAMAAPGISTARALMMTTSTIRTNTRRTIPTNIERSNTSFTQISAVQIDDVACYQSCPCWEVRLVKILKPKWCIKGA